MASDRARQWPSTKATRTPPGCREEGRVAALSRVVVGFWLLSIGGVSVVAKPPKTPKAGTGVFGWPGENQIPGLKVEAIGVARDRGAMS